MDEDSKLCTKCNVTKGVSQFNWRDTAHTKLQSYCRECSNESWRTWYQNKENRAKHLKTLKSRRRRRTDRHQELIRTLKSQPCADCGGTFPPCVMDFDHLNEKTGLVSSLVFQNGTERLLEEVQKCEVVCANCHRIRTQNRLNPTGLNDSSMEPFPQKAVPAEDLTR